MDDSDGEYKLPWLKALAGGVETSVGTLVIVRRKSLTNRPMPAAEKRQGKPSLTVKGEKELST